LPWYRNLFSDDELATAERRLIGHQFDVEPPQKGKYLPTRLGTFVTIFFASAEQFS
jgi:hypothetical protein